MTTSKSTYRKTILIDGKQIPVHLLWTDEGHHIRPNSSHIWRMIDGRYRQETEDGTITTSERPKFPRGTYLPIRVVVVRVPSGNAAIGSLWRSHLSAPSAADRDVLISLVDSEDARWIRLASRINMFHEDRVGHVENSIRSGMTIRLELSL